MFEPRYNLRAFEHPGARISFLAVRNLLIVMALLAFITRDLSEVAIVLGVLFFFAMAFFIMSMYYGTHLRYLEREDEKAAWYPEKKIAPFYFGTGAGAAGAAGYAYGKDSFGNDSIGPISHIDTTPSVNINGLPMIPNSGIDVMGNPYGTDNF